jgi:two-component system response regulator MtrA
VKVQQQVLIVEDDEAIREVAGLVLERAGFAVTGVGSGLDAVGYVDREGDGIDLIVLDLMLPGMHGFDVCREVRSRSGVPIVMLTARADSADVVAGLELGADDYITKPFEPAELVARARAVLRRYAEAAPVVLRALDLVIDEGPPEARVWAWPSPTSTPASWEPRWRSATGPKGAPCSPSGCTGR